MLKQEVNLPIKIIGVIERVTFYNELNGFCVFKLQVHSDKSNNKHPPITVIGCSAEIAPGEEAECTGVWVNDPAHGLQFKASTIALSVPTSIVAIEKYLGSGLIKGIGPGFAKRLLTQFGEKILQIIEETPDKLLEMPGIGQKRYQKILDNWSNQKEIRKIIMFLQQHGIGSARAIKIYKVYQTDAIAKIKENPYRLASDIYGIGFTIADKLALSLGIPHNSVIRAEAGIRFILQQWANNGNCAIHLIELIKQTKDQLQIDEEFIRSAIKSESVANRIKIEKLHKDSLDLNLPNVNWLEVGSDYLIFLMPIYLAEKYIAKKVFQLQQGRPVWHNLLDLTKEIRLMEHYAKIKFSPSQILAIETAVCSKFIVITGGPGVGKTTVARSILHLISNQTNKILLCAPTGKAAKRLTETTNMPATTLHRLLAFDISSRKFKFNENNLLDVKLLLVDEVSMIDLLMFANLLKALPLDCSVILMGDVDQLPSIGVGKVLADLIGSDCIKAVKLQEIFRQASNSQIVFNAHRINQGSLPVLDYTPVGNQDPDFYFIKINEVNQLHAKILQIIDRIKAKFCFNIFKDVQILSPMNKGQAGVMALNNLLQSQLNRNINNPGLRISKFGTNFVVGDKIIQNVNNYDKEVFNGDLGVVEDLDLEDGNLLINFDGRLVSYDFNDLDEINLAYAITIHKSQGSEYPVVIIPVCLQHYTLLQRNLIYTAVTRGKSLVIIVGEVKALAIAVKNQGITRITRLQYRLVEEFSIK